MFRPVIANGVFKDRAQHGVSPHAAVEGFDQRGDIGLIYAQSGGMGADGFAAFGNIGGLWMRHDSGLDALPGNGKA